MWRTRWLCTSQWAACSCAAVAVVGGGGHNTRQWWTRHRNARHRKRRLQEPITRVASQGTPCADPVAGHAGAAGHQRRVLRSSAGARGARPERCTMRTRMGSPLPHQQNELNMAPTRVGCSALQFAAREVVSHRAKVAGARMRAAAVVADALAGAAAVVDPCPICGDACESVAACGCAPTSTPCCGALLCVTCAARLTREDGCFVCPFCRSSTALADGAIAATR